MSDVERQYEEFFLRATGQHSYPYQTRIGVEGLPELLKVPTGCGKTAAAVVGWLFRRLGHPDNLVREQTPNWLVFTLPMRVLVEQTVGVVEGWLRALGLRTEVRVITLMGGEPRPTDWRLHPEKPTIFVGTFDMVLSRALNRGFGESRYVWPIDFGLFNSGCHFVFDEVQLMGPALKTSRQLQGLRASLGMVAPCSSTWMSATVPEDLATVDAPHVTSTVSLEADDITPSLARRLEAPKRLGRLLVDPKSPKDLAAEVVRRHRSGTVTLVIVNTVDVAREVHRAVRRVATGTDVVLLHSRFRPEDRKEAVNRALDRDTAGRIVVSTQVIEAGVDMSASLVITEAASWSAFVQRCGRCNRDGLSPDAEVLWLDSAKHPYAADDVAATVAHLSGLEGAVVSPAALASMKVPESRQIAPVLRRRDLLDLFDTFPDLSGNDIDIAKFIRDSDDIDVSIAWRSFESNPPADTSLPTKNERCPVPISEVRHVLKRGAALWRFDPLARQWTGVRADDVRPGQVYLASSALGMYSAAEGWDPAIRRDVEVMAPESRDEDSAVGDDPDTFNRPWTLLRDHLADTRRECLALTSEARTPGIEPTLVHCAVRAAELHDIGKAHEVFQSALRRSGSSDAPQGLLAKSPEQRRSLDFGPDRRFFRHELVSALMLLAEGPGAGVPTREFDMLVYLVAAHHGRVRLGARPLRGEPPDNTVLGVRHGDQVPEVHLPEGALRPIEISTAAFRLGGDGWTPSWASRVLKLRDDPDIGPFRLAWLEAAVRLADWRASAVDGPAPEWTDNA